MKMIIYISQNPNKETRIKMREGKLSRNMIEHSPEKFVLCVQIQGIYHNIKSWCCFRRWLQIMFSEMFSATTKRNRMLIFAFLSFTLGGSREQILEHVPVLIFFVFWFH